MTKKRLNLRVLQATHDTLSAMASRYSALVGSGQRGPRRPTSCAGMGPFMDLIAAHLEAFLESLPEEKREMFAGKVDGRKLTPEQVQLIRLSVDKQMAIAAQFGVSVGMVSMIRSGKRRKDRLGLNQRPPDYESDALTN